MPKRKLSDKDAKKASLERSEKAFSSTSACVAVQDHFKFCRSFKRPSLSESFKAIGRVPEEQKSLYNDKDLHFFEPIPEPTSLDDWLAHVPEAGQSFRQFMEECPWISGRKIKLWHSEFSCSGKSITDRYPKGKIYILPVGTWSQDAGSDLNGLVRYASIFLNIPVKLLPSVPVLTTGDKIHVDMTYFQKDQGERNERRHSARIKEYKRIVSYRTKEGHRQVKAASLLDLLKTHLPHNALCLVGLTMEDLYQDSSDLFVAGLAEGNNRVAVFSFARYDPDLDYSPEHWYKINKRQTRSENTAALVFKHSCKLLVHEICHLLGIDHCIWYRCCMNGSGHVREDFSQPMFLCPVDLRKLQVLSQFNVQDRYQKLLEFFKAHDYREEALWLEQRLQYIGG